jgi:hypothetical protein
VVVGTEHVDAQVEAALTLVEVVGDVAGDVGGLAVTLDDDAVLVVAVVGGAQPGRTVLLVDLAVLAQPAMAWSPAGGVHRVLVGEHVEVGAELVQRGLDLGEHQVDADGAEGLLLLVGRQDSASGALEHLGGDVVDVVAGVAVLRGRFALGGGDQRAGEAVDLGAVVVEVVLADHLGPWLASSRPSASPTAAQRVPPMWMGRWGWPRRTRG